MVNCEQSKIPSTTQSVSIKISGKKIPQRIELKSLNTRREFTSFTGKLDFGEKGSRTLMPEGWSRDEKDGKKTFVWAASKIAAILLPFRTKASYNIRFTARPFLPKNTLSKPVQITVNNKPIYSFFMQKGWKQYFFVIPKNVAKRGNNVISFHFASIISPHDAKKGTDVRPLAACFDELTFQIKHNDVSQIKPNYFPLNEFFGDEFNDLPAFTGTRIAYKLEIPYDASLSYAFNYEHSKDKQQVNTSLVLNQNIHEKIDIIDAYGQKHSLVDRVPSYSKKQKISLNKFAGQEIELSFEVNGNTKLQNLFWGNPSVSGNWIQKNLQILKSQTEHIKHTFCIIGFDGLSWKVLNELINKGDLPNFKKIISEGYCSPFKTLIPTKSPVLWTSIATGKVPAKHGIDDFMRWDLKKNIRIPLTANYRKTKFLWNILSDLKKRVSVIGWWPSWPAEPINGYMVTNQRGADKQAKETWPPSLFKKIQKFHSVKEFPYNKFFPAPYDSLRGMIGSYHLQPYEKFFIEKHLQRVYLRDNYFFKTTRYLLQKEKTDFCAVYFNGVDPVCHLFWKYYRPKYFSIDKAQISALGLVIQGIYRYADELLGKLLRVLPDDTDIFIVSDHGFGRNPIREFSIQTNKLLNIAGYLTFQKGNQKADINKSSLFVGPSFSNALRQKLRVCKRLKDNPIKMKLMLNKFKKEMESNVYTESGVHFLTVDLNAGKNFDCTLTFKLAVCLDQRIVIKGKKVPFQKIFLEKHISGIHSDAPDGVLIIKGPDFKKKRYVQPQYADFFNSLNKKPILMDIVPTILYLNRLPQAMDMDGRVLFETLKKKEEAEAKHNLMKIQSYDKIGKPFKSSEATLDQKTRQNYEERLRVLGYIN